MTDFSIGKYRYFSVDLTETSLSCFLWVLHLLTRKYSVCVRKGSVDVNIVDTFQGVRN